MHWVLVLYLAGYLGTPWVPQTATGGPVTIGPYSTKEDCESVSENFPTNDEIKIWYRACVAVR